MNLKAVLKQEHQLPANPKHDHFMEVMRYEFEGAMMEVLSNNRRFVFGHNYPDPVYAINCQSIPTLWKLHDWEIYRIPRAACYQCEGTGVWNDSADYCCDVCNGSGFQPAIVSGTCRRCGFTKSL